VFIVCSRFLFKNETLSFNFVDNNDNVAPEFFYNIPEKAAFYTEYVYLIVITFHQSIIIVFG
jgi:hypothetical protein